MTDKPTPTDAELKAMWQLHAADIGGIFHYARAVLAKWGTPTPVGAEPVARLEIESLKAQLHAAKQINAAQFGLLAASIPGSALRTSHGQAQADSVPKAQFDDPKVQAVYAILCEDAEPPKGEHWEGFAARRIVDALLADSVLEDAARYRLLRRGQHWSVVDGIGNYLRAEALDAAVDEARKQGEKQ